MKPESSRLLARVLVASAARILPHRYLEWADAMREELEYVPPRAQAAWACGNLFAACNLRANESSIIYAAAALLLAATLVVVDWNTANDSVTLGVLVLLSATLGFLRPDRALLSTCTVGSSLLAAHTFANFTGWLLPFYQCKPLAPDDFLVLTLLALPTLAGVKAGARLRAIVSRS
jgi:hypothetical protein